MLLMLGAKDVSAYWSNRTFDGFPVIPIPVSSDERKGDVFKSASKIEKFISSLLENIKQGKHPEALKLFKLLINHADRRKNEIIIRKCQFIPNRISCKFCQSHAVKSGKMLDVLRASKGMFEPAPSPHLEGYYMTFSEMLNTTDRCHFASPNEGLQRKLIGKCKVCPAWEFSSIIEGKRHVSILHPNYVRKDMFQDVTCTCKYKDCNKMFETQYCLAAHKKIENHYLRQKRGKDNGDADKAAVERKRKKATETITTFCKGRNSDEVGGNQE